MLKPGHYSEHFTHREMMASETAARAGIDNTPPPEARVNLARLCNLLETVRARFGPVRITSGYRCPRLNGMIGGSDTSAHMDGRAADLQPLDPGVTLLEVMTWVVANMQRLGVDQVIYEFGSWIHIGIAPEGAKPRHQALMVYKGTGYTPWNPMQARGGA